MSINAMRGAKKTAVKEGIKPSIRLTFYVLADLASPAGVSFPSIETLATETGKSPRQIKRDLAWLVDSEIIEVTYRPGKTAVYVLPIDDPKGVTPMTAGGDTHVTPQAPKGVTPMVKGGDTHDTVGVTPMTAGGDMGDTHNSINSNITEFNKEDADPIPVVLVNRWIEETKAKRPTKREIGRAQAWYEVFEQIHNDFGDRGFGMMIDAWNRKNKTPYKTSDPEKIREFMYREIVPSRGNVVYETELKPAPNGSF